MELHRRTELCKVSVRTSICLLCYEQPGIKSSNLLIFLAWLYDVKDVPTAKINMINRSTGNEMDIFDIKDKYFLADQLKSHVFSSWNGISEGC